MVGEVGPPECQQSRRWDPIVSSFTATKGLNQSHVHAQREGRLAKFWLEPVALAGTSGFTGQELRKIEKLVVAKRDKFVEAWHEYFDR
jgi:hypothetical protein